jgi:hypothetical protein
MVANIIDVSVIQKERENAKKTMDCLTNISVILSSCLLHKKLERNSTNTWVISLFGDNYLTTGTVELVGDEYVTCVLHKKDGTLCTFLNNNNRSIEDTVKLFVANIEKDLL